MRMKHRVFLCAPLSLLLFCALRDNPYDPESPFHIGPEITISLKFDTTKVGSISENTISGVKAPFQITVNALSIDKIEDRQRPVKFYHFVNGDNIFDDSISNATDYSVKCNMGGTHRLKFTSEANTGALTEKTITIQVKKPNYPTIISFTAFPDSFPLNAPNDDRGPPHFYVLVSDPDTLADSIFYYVTQSERIAHSLDASNIIDTVISGKKSLYFLDESIYSYTFDFSDSTEDTIFTVRAVLTDILGQHSEESIDLLFSRSLDTAILGEPPQILEIILSNPLSYLTIDTAIYFDLVYETYDSVSYITDFIWRAMKGSTKFEKSSTTSSSVYFKFDETGTWTVVAELHDNLHHVVTDTQVVTIIESDDTRPVFTKFELSTDSGASPLQIYLTVEAEDNNSKIRNFDYRITDADSTTWITRNDIKPPMENEPLDLLRRPGTYTLQVWARNYFFKSCDTTVIITVTRPE